MSSTVLTSSRRELQKASKSVDEHSVTNVALPLTIPLHPSWYGVPPTSRMSTLTPTSEDTRIYECAILYPYPISQKEEQEVLKEVEHVFKDAGALQVAKDLWGRRGLAYQIKGYTEGCFAIYHYDMDPTKIREIDEALRIVPGVLRHLIIKPPKGYEVVNFSEKYEQWLKEREEAEELREEEKEKELTRRITQKAKHQVKRAEEKKVPPTKEKKALEGNKITEEIEKLISDDELNL